MFSVRLFSLEVIVSLCLYPDTMCFLYLAASAGNHAQGLAYHAGRLGVRSTIYMPLGTNMSFLTS